MVGWGFLFGVILGLPFCALFSRHYSLSAGRGWLAVLAAFGALPLSGLVYGALFAAPIGAWLLWDRSMRRAGPWFVGPALLITLIGAAVMTPWFGAGSIVGITAIVTVCVALVVRRLVPRLTIFDGRCPSCCFDNRRKGLRKCPHCGFDFGQAHTSCTKCGYDLRGISSPVCPECGSMIARWTRPFSEPAPGPGPDRTDLCN